MRSALFVSIAAVALGATASAGDYSHDAWPVANDGNGVYSFTDAGQAKAVSLCAAFYAADIKAMDEHGIAGGYGQVVRAHASVMLDAYKAKFSGGEAELDQLASDMIWHFGNSAQYGSFQEFKDSANMACESYAVQMSIISPEYLNGFNDKLLAAL